MAEPVDQADFTRALDALGPFEPAPHLAIAVSGGADSLALAALGTRWLEARGGSGTALTVDHGLRAAARHEALWVEAACRRLKLAHRTLRWTPPSAGATPTSQARAREARYRLLDEACAELGCLHLLVAHHATDQAATIAMRRRRGPGPGLAGMAAVRELRHCRLLRPLLTVSPEPLRATAQALGFGWIEDPSNRDPRFERATVDISGSAPGPACARTETEHRDARWLAHHARREAGGRLSLDGPAWRALEPEAAARILAASTAHVGARRWPPSVRRAAAVAARLQGGARQLTLAGAVVGWRGDRLRLVPEAKGAPGTSRTLAAVPFATADVASDATLLI